MGNENEILWTSGFINERLPAPISPLGWSHIGPCIESLALRDPLRFLGYPEAETIPLTRLWRGHPYVNARAFQIIYKIFPDWILPEDAYRYFPNGDVSQRRRAPYPRGRDAPRVMAALLRTLFSDPFNVSPLHNYRHWARAARAHDARIAALRARVETLSCDDPHALFDALRTVEDLHRDVLRIHRWSLIDADLTFGLLKRLIGAWLARDHVNDIAARLVADVPNKTLEVDAAIQKLTMDNGQLSMDNFLAEHGHRSFSLDLAVPTFAEAPAQITRLLQTPGDERSKTQDASSSCVLAPSSFVQKTIFAQVLALARRYLALREDQRYYWQKSLALARRLYLLLAESLLRAGVIAERDAVFYATHAELAAYFDARLPKTELAHTIAARQSEWRVYQREFQAAPTRAYPLFLRGEVPLEDGAARAARSAWWRGRALSPGVARGAARIVHSADELARVQRGDVLIAPATDPAWTPVFVRLAGLVVERGGVLSHSAVIAREYRLPAVAGIANIVAEIQEGEIVEVDGSRGIVARVAA